jgi:hypothetical protein
MKSKEELIKESAYQSKQVARFFLAFVLLVGLFLVLLKPILLVVWLALIALGLAWASSEMKKDADKELEKIK